MMDIDKTLSVNLFPGLKQDKDFYTKVGICLILFSVVYKSTLIFAKRIDPTVDEFSLLSENAGFIIDKIRKLYKGRPVKWTGDAYEKLVNDRNKIVHGVIDFDKDKQPYYVYKLKNGEIGEITEKFFIDFINDCNIFISAIAIQDDQISKELELDDIVNQKEEK